MMTTSTVRMRITYYSVHIAAYIERVNKSAWTESDDGANHLIILKFIYRPNTKHGNYAILLDLFTIHGNHLDSIIIYRTHWKSDVSTEWCFKIYVYHPYQQKNIQSNTPSAPPKTCISFRFVVNHFDCLCKSSLKINSKKEKKRNVKMLDKTSLTCWFNIVRFARKTPCKMCFFFYIS